MPRDNERDRIFMYGPWVSDDDVDIVVDALRNGWYEHAYDYVEAFEADFARYHDRNYALMTPSCTTALHLLLKCLGIGPGDEVIVPECTWIATAAPITYVGADAVFCDIDPVTWCLDPKSVEAAITERTKAIVAVDLFGNMADMVALGEIAEQHGIALVEDSAEALGSELNNMRAGKFGVGSVFSFHRTKTITTGEGGMLLLDDDTLFERCKLYRDHGRAPYSYLNEIVGFKYMPSNLAASLGYAQFKRIDQLIARKREIFATYRARLGDLPDVYLNPDQPGVTNGYWTPAIVFGPSYGISAEEVEKRMTAESLPTRPFFRPLSSLPAYPGREAAGRRANPVAYDVSGRGLNLPAAYNLSSAQIDRICDGIERVIT